MGEFCLPEHFKWRKNYSWSPLVFSCFRSKVDLIIRFLWPGYQWTSQQRPYLMRRLTQRRWTDGSNQTDESFSGVINSTRAALDARPLRFWACVTVNYQTGKSRARGRSKHTSPSTYRTCVCVQHVHGNVWAFGTGIYKCENILLDTKTHTLINKINTQGYLLSTLFLTHCTLRESWVWLDVT